MNITNNLNTAETLKHISKSKQIRNAYRNKPSTKTLKPSVNLQMSSTSKELLSKALNLFDKESSIRSDKVSSAKEKLANWSGLNNNQMMAIANGIAEDV